jgi:sodium/hydrogen antiporter
VTALLLVFGTGLLLAVLMSSLASRSPLSTSAVFLVVGLVAGPMVLDVVDLPDHVVERFAEVALFTILFTDGQHAPWRTVRAHWGPPARALLIGMPLTFALVTVVAHWVAGVPWPAAVVLGAVLAPTDPVFASALVGRDDVPRRVRDLLNIESGLNDGLALPAVLILVSLGGGQPEGWSTEPWTLLGELVLGVVLGVTLPTLVWLVIRIPGVGSVETLRPLGPLAIAVLLFATCELLEANSFLAAFVGGSVIATLAPAVSESFRGTGEIVSEVVKGAALIAFASLLDRETFAGAGWTGWVAAALVLIVTRPLPILLVLAGTTLSPRERISVAWFGPKGFASVAYAVIVGFSGMPGSQAVLDVAAVTVLLSIIAHSSTDVAVAGWLQAPDGEGDQARTATGAERGSG